MPFRCRPLTVAILCGFVLYSVSVPGKSDADDEVGDASAAKSSVGRQIDGFSLPDLHGNSKTLDDLADGPLLVVAFLGTECPLAKFYGPRLQEMSEQYADRGVRFVGINSNTQDSLTEIAGYARRHAISFPMLKDLKNEVAELLGATRTPEVFVLDDQRIVRYHGRVDAQFTFGSGVGLAQPNKARDDLKIALNQLLAGEDVTVPHTPVKGCLIGRVKAPQPQATVTYAKQISRLVQKHCLQCHRTGQIAPFSMETYDDVAGWGEMIAEVVHERRMPPWHAGDQSTGDFINDARLTAEERQQFYDWVEQGCPEGDPQDMPEKRTFHEGWFTEEPFDQVIYIADEAVPVKAAGIEEYRYYEVAGVDKDRWVEAIECMPGNHAVVHHIILYARPPGGRPIAPGTTGIDTQHFSWLAGFAPGTRPTDVPSGWARWVPAGYSLVFELHYTPIGTPQTDRSSVGLRFVDAADVKRVLHTSAAIKGEFVIPAHAANFPVTATKNFEHDTTLLALFPHMHVRGKSFQYEFTFPDGHKELMLDVPTYDFNWQNSYTLREPVPIPKGTTLVARARYDNSDANLANPNPNEEVRWGAQSWEEMMIGFYDVGVTKEQAKALLQHKASQLAELRKEGARE